MTLPVAPFFLLLLLFFLLFFAPLVYSQMKPIRLVLTWELELMIPIEDLSLLVVVGAPFFTFFLGEKWAAKEKTTEERNRYRPSSFVSRFFESLNCTNPIMITMERKKERKEGERESSVNRKTASLSSSSPTSLPTICGQHQEVFLPSRLDPNKQHDEEDAPQLKAKNKRNQKQTAFVIQLSKQDQKIVGKKNGRVSNDKDKEMKI